MASRSAECYRSRAKDCCRKAVIAEDIDQRTHWLEAAARWVSLARQEGILLPAQTKAVQGRWPGRNRCPQSYRHDYGRRPAGLE